MGRASLEGMKGMLNQDAMLRWHLQSNHYPPVNVAFIPVAKEAIKFAKRGLAEDDGTFFDRELKMPNGKCLTVRAIIEQLHLDSFLDT